MKVSTAPVEKAYNSDNTEDDRACINTPFHHGVVIIGDRSCRVYLSLKVVLLPISFEALSRSLDSTKRTLCSGEQTASFEIIRNVTFNTTEKSYIIPYTLCRILLYVDSVWQQLI